MDVEDFVVGFHEGFERSICKVDDEGYVQEVYQFFICFNGDFEAFDLKISLTSCLFFFSRQSF